MYMTILKSFYYTTQTQIINIVIEYITMKIRNGQNAEIRIFLSSFALIRLHQHNMMTNINARIIKPIYILYSAQYLAKQKI